MLDGKEQHGYSSKCTQEQSSNVYFQVKKVFKTNKITRFLTASQSTPKQWSLTEYGLEDLKQSIWALTLYLQLCRDRNFPTSVTKPLHKAQTQLRFLDMHKTTVHVRNYFKETTKAQQSKSEKESRKTNSGYHESRTEMEAYKSPGQNVQNGSIGKAPPPRVLWPLKIQEANSTRNQLRKYLQLSAWWLTE